MKLTHRIQEWLADRFSSIQYPNIRPANELTRAASRSGFRFTYPMSIGKRIDTFLFSFLLLLIGLVALFFVGLFIYLLL